jgi:hypothetical protein
VNMDTTQRVRDIAKNLNVVSIRVDRQETVYNFPTPSDATNFRVAVASILGYYAIGDSDEPSSVVIGWGFDGEGKPISGALRHLASKVIEAVKNFDGKQYNQKNWSDAALDGVSLRGATLYKCNLSGASLKGADMTGASLKYCIFSGADMRGAKLDGASCVYADMRDANLSGASLVGTDLSQAVLKDAILVDADMTDADLGMTNLDYANLTGTIVTHRQLSHTSLVRVNTNTILSH